MDTTFSLDAVTRLSQSRFDRVAITSVFGNPRELRTWSGAPANVASALERLGVIVEEEARSCGIGTQLLGAAEDWARRHGCAKLRVHSNVVRERAHDFYQRHGYTTIKAQYNLHKRL